MFNEGLARQAARLTERFPTGVQQDIFLEFELGQQAAPAGFGLGLTAGELDHYRVVRHPFLRTSTGRAIESAFAQDPFAADHVLHLNLFGDADPDWIEYDIAFGKLDTAPFVFFRMPSRFARITNAEEVEGLCALLPGPATGSGFEQLLLHIAGAGAFCPYRIGLSARRGPDWWRAIISDLTADQVAIAAEYLNCSPPCELLRAACGLYDRAMDCPGARFSLSVDVTGGQIMALDVETPFLFRIEDPAARAAPFAEYVGRLTEMDLASSWTADWLNDNLFRVLRSPDGRAGLRILLHHLKFRLFGAPYLRTKAYVLASLDQSASSLADG